MISPKDIVQTVYYGAAIVGIVATIIKVFYGWFRGDQISKKFIIEMAEHHLPYIYMELQHRNPNCKYHPPISFINIKDK